MCMLKDVHCVWSPVGWTGSDEQGAHAGRPGGHYWYVFQYLVKVIKVEAKKEYSIVLELGLGNFVLLSTSALFSL